MGNTQHRGNQRKNAKVTISSEREGQAYTSQFSLSHFVGNLSGRSIVSGISNQSVYSASRPWSRVSRSRWSNNTLNSPLEASKTAWPVSHRESLFLPHFPIATELFKKKFQIQEKIAKGAFGEVCKVKKNSEEKVFALKVLNKSQVVSENAVQQVIEEVRIQEVCGHHTFIVSTLERWQTKKNLYIVSEYIPGGELLDLIVKYAKLPEELVKLFVAEIAIAIDFLHNAGVLYRDLKPENILLDEDLHIRLTDFGLSKWLTVGARTTTLCGTLNYMAPEILRGEPYGHAVDWWSLGVVACRMLTGELPVTAQCNGRYEQQEDSGGTDAAMDVTERISLREMASTSAVDSPSIRSVGTLPDSVDVLSKEARGLLIRVLDKDPRHRLRTLRQLQQTAFYMGYNFEDVKYKKISPRSIIEQHFPSGSADLMETDEIFSSFDQMIVT